MSRPPRTSQPEASRRYGPDPASAAIRYHLSHDSVQHTSLQSRPHPTMTTGPPVSQQSSSTASGGYGTANSGPLWFDQFNSTVGEPQISLDAEPPFFPRRPGSSSSDLSSDTNIAPRQAQNPSMANLTRPANAEETDSSKEDYRSIIDDLTVEVQHLRERARRAEAALSPSGAQADRLFEIKVHGLPAHKKKELIDTLHNFAQGIDLSPAADSVSYISMNRSVEPYGQLPESLAGERFDSSYASASASGQFTTPIVGRKRAVSKKKPRQELAQPLEGTPAGLLYKGYDSSMTDREKKIMVVKRLEHLFKVKENQHSKSAKTAPITEAHAVLNHITEQMREAQILSSIEEFPHTASTHQESKKTMDYEGEERDEGEKGQPEAESPLSPQRETRALDVDPDRVQVPQENINYIRHLGISTKPLGQETDDPETIHGWVYLNILFNMAQLHIFDVTPDFVRSAITELSTRFELSADRQRVRWHSGSADARPGSSSESEHAMRDATTDSSDSGSKRRKVAGVSDTEFHDPHREHGNPNIAFSVNRLGRSGQGRRRHDLEYKPLFFRAAASSGRMHYYDDTASGHPQRSTIDGDAHGSAPATMMTQGTFNSLPGSDSGPIVFFSGAAFVTDLSGDSPDTIAYGQPRYFHEAKKSSITPLGSDKPLRPRPTLTRSDSGSRIRARPFKDYSKGGEMLQQETRLKTPEPVCSDDANSNDMSFDPRWTDDSKSASPQERIKMEVSGLGGTKPDDNFVVIVETSHPKMRSGFHKQLQAEVATVLDPERKVAKLLHMIEEAKLGPAKSSKQWKGKEPTQPSARPNDDHAPVKITILSKRELRLQPSEIPPPAQIWDDDSDSDNDSDVSMESSRTDRDIQCLKNSPPDVNAAALEESEDDDDDDDDDDGSIDMMGYDRVNNPTLVAEREGTYERQLRMVAEGGQPNQGSGGATAGDEDEEDEVDEDGKEEEEGDDSGDEDEDASMKA